MIVAASSLYRPVLPALRLQLPARPVLSLPGSSYDNLNNTLAKYFDEIEGANIETNTQMAREILEKTELALTRV